MIKISAVVLAKNEKDNIKDCISGLAFCDEIIVVDDNSSDKTAIISKKLGAKVYKRDMNMDFSAQSNFGMEKAKGKWILFVDADERIGEKLFKEIVERTKYEQKIEGFYIKRVDFIWGKELVYGEAGNIRLMRLVRKGSGSWIRRVHPHFEIKGAVSSLKNPIMHYPHPDISSFILSVDRWSSWHALANSEEGKKSNILKICLWPPAHFIRNYFLRLGFLDGIHGFIFALLMSFHSYLAWSKLYLMQKIDE